MTISGVLLNNRNICSHSREAESLKQGVGRATRLLTPFGEDPSVAFPAPGGCHDPWSLLACTRIPLVSTVPFVWRAPLRESVPLCALDRKNTVVLVVWTLGPALIPPGLI